MLEARRLILAGEADVVIAGGADAGINEVVFAGLSNMGPLSERNDDPAGASRPFDSDRDGFVFGEGAVVLVIESAEHAAARGATVLRVIAGGALTSDAFHMSAPEPSGEYAVGGDPPGARTRRHHPRGARLRLRPRHRDPGQRPPRAGDPPRPRRRHRSTPVSSPKSMVGHLIAAAGGLAAMVCLLAMRDGVIPPTINLTTLTPSATWTTSPSPPASRQRHLDRQRLRLRRPELRRRLPSLGASVLWVGDPEGAGGTDDRAPGDALEELTGRYPQRAGDLDQGVEARKALAALDQAHLGSVHVCSKGQFLLAQSRGVTLTGEVRTEALIDVHLARVFVFADKTSTVVP